MNVSAETWGSVSIHWDLVTSSPSASFWRQLLREISASLAAKMLHCVHHLLSVCRRSFRALSPETPPAASGNEADESGDNEPKQLSCGRKTETMGWKTIKCSIELRGAAQLDHKWKKEKKTASLISVLRDESPAWKSDVPHANPPPPHPSLPSLYKGHTQRHHWIEIVSCTMQSNMNTLVFPCVAEVQSELFL